MRTIPIRRQDQPAQASTAVDAGPGAGGGSQLTALPPLSLYVHVPWCVRKCPYCDFNSHAAPQELPEQQYLAALSADLQQALPLIWGRRIVSVFIGGGTPSLLSERALDDLLSMVRSHLSLLPGAEVTLEANPGTVEAQRFQSYAASGVNRISLGVQSFNDTALHALGRIHNGEQAKRAIAAAQSAVQRVNLDLMTALPGQTMAALRADVQTALNFNCEHVSLYHLTMEPATVFAKYPPADLPDDDTAADMQDTVAQLLTEAGYDHYEVSAYARPGARCVHNLNYWQFGDYLGIGPGAHSKLSFHDRIIRQARVRNPDSWMQRAMLHDGAHLAEDRPVATTELPFEFMLNVLRLRDGVPVGYFFERTGLSLAVIAAHVQRAADKKLLTADPTRLAPTEQGWRFLSDLQAMFL